MGARRAGLTALLLAAAAPAAAQVDPMQQCVWSCLANSRGASDPAYHACVAARCSGTPGPARWTAQKTDPRDPPYLDGFAVRAETRDTGLSVTYTCGRNGDSWMSFWSQTLANRYGLRGVLPVDLGLILFIDQTHRYRIDATNYEGELVGAINLNNSVFGHLANAREITLWAEDRSFLGTLPTEGADMLGKAAAACRGS